MLRVDDRKTLQKDSYRITTKIKTELEKKHLTLETKRSEGIILTGKKKDRKDAKISLEEGEINPSTSMKHLGIHLSKNLGMSVHIT